MSARATARAWELARRLSTPSERLVLLALADTADQNNKGQYTVVELARATGLSGGAVRMAVDALSYRYLKVMGGPEKGVHRYELWATAVSVVKASGAA